MERLMPYAMMNRERVENSHGKTQRHKEAFL